MIVRRVEGVMGRMMEEVNQSNIDFKHIHRYHSVSPYTTIYANKNHKKRKKLNIFILFHAYYISVYVFSIQIIVFYRFE
jgi:hypothetical protein